jgi:signal transduction histidine kinase
MWGWISSTPLWKETGEFTGVLGMLIDVSSRKSAEENLRNVVTQARCILWSASIRRVENGFDWMLEIPDEEAAQHVIALDVSERRTYAQAWVASRNPEDRIASDRLSEWALNRNENHYSHEFRCVNQEGDLIWLHEDATLRRIGEDRWEAVGVCTDISNRKSLEEKIRRDAALAKALLQLNQMTDVSLEEMRRIVFENLLSITDSQFGYALISEGKGAGYKGFMLSAKSEKNPMAESVMALTESDVRRWVEGLEREGAISDIEDGSPGLETLQAIWSGIPLKRQLHTPIWEGESLVLIAGIAALDREYEDIDTEHLIIMIDGFYRILKNRRSEATQRAMEIQLRHAQKLEAVGQLAAGVAHEINTPIQFIGDNLQFLSASFADLSKVLGEVDSLIHDPEEFGAAVEKSKALQEAHEAADAEYLIDEIPKAIGQSIEGVQRVTKIVRALKEFSHPDRQEKSPADLNKALENAVTVSRNEWKYVAEMELDLEPSLPLVTCQLGSINQVLLNLIVNAAQAIDSDVNRNDERKGIIRVSSRSDAERVEMRISDNGPGVPHGIRDRIFDPFFTTKEVGKGTGQGLAIAYNVMTIMHQGYIRLESGEGEGATFILGLPLDDHNSAKESVFSVDEFNLTVEMLDYIEDDAIPSEAVF